jgi:hypothetical protein
VWACRRCIADSDHLDVRVSMQPQAHVRAALQPKGRSMRISGRNTCYLQRSRFACNAAEPAGNGATAMSPSIKSKRAAQAEGRALRKPAKVTFCSAMSFNGAAPGALLSLARCRLSIRQASAAVGEASAPEFGKVPVHDGRVRKYRWTA